MVIDHHMSFLSSYSYQHHVIILSPCHHIIIISWQPHFQYDGVQRSMVDVRWYAPPPPPTMLHITPIVLNIVLHHTILIIIFCPLKLFWCFNLLVCAVQAIVWLCTNTKKAFERYTQELLLSSAEKKLLLNLGILH